MLPRSTDANLSRRFTRLSCERSSAGTMYHSMMALRSELGVSECLFRPMRSKGVVQEADHVREKLGVGSS